MLTVEQLARHQRAIKCGLKVNGKAAFSYPVLVTFGQDAVYTQETSGYRTATFRVIAHTAADAANYALDQFAGIPCTQVEVVGVRGWSRRPPLCWF